MVQLESTDTASSMIAQAKMRAAINNPFEANPIPLYQGSMIMTHMMRAGTAVRVGKYRSYDAVASYEDFDARGGRFQPHPAGPGAFASPRR